MKQRKLFTLPRDLTQSRPKIIEILAFIRLEQTHICLTSISYVNRILLQEATTRANLPNTWSLQTAHLILDHC